MALPRPLPTITESSTLLDRTNYHLPSRDPRRLSPPRPLPTVPQGLCCKRCKTHITSPDVALMAPSGRGFRGYSGKASLFTEAYNITLQKPKKMLMVSGCHTLQQIDCAVCVGQYLGFKVVESCDESERWKEGHFLLELEFLDCLLDSPPPQAASPSLAPAFDPAPSPGLRSNSPKFAQTYGRSSSPMYPETYIQPSSPRTRAQVRSNSPMMYAQKFDRSSSPMYAQTHDRSSSPLYSQTYDRSSSPLYTQTYDRSSSPMFTESSGRSSSPMSSHRKAQSVAQLTPVRRYM